VISVTEGPNKRLWAVDDTVDSEKKQQKRGGQEKNGKTLQGWGAGHRRQKPGFHSFTKKGGPQEAGSAKSSGEGKRLGINLTNGGGCKGGRGRSEVVRRNTIEKTETGRGEARLDNAKSRKGKAFRYGKRIKWGRGGLGGDKKKNRA